MKTAEITEIPRQHQIEALLSHFDFDKVKKGRTKYQRALDANWSQNCSRFQRNKK